MMLPPESVTSHERWYCLGCARGFTYEYESKNHVKTCQPGVEIEQGVTHAQGWQVEQMRERFLKEIAPRVRVFIVALRQVNYGPEDFLTDCGYMAP